MARIAFGQMNAVSDAAANLKKAADLAAQAAARNADMLVLPEYCMAYPGKDEPFPPAQALDGPFVTGLCAAARKNRIYIACGILERSDREMPYNSMVIIDRSGALVRVQRKTHMYDTDQYRESDHFLLGDKLFQPLDTDFGRLGLLICYELRLPELARLQALDGAQLLVVCAAFVEGAHKSLQWHTLLAARAIENAVFVCGCDHVKPKVFLGESCAYDPNGELLAACGKEEGLEVVTCDLNRLPEYRKTNTSIFTRRPELCALAREKRENKEM